MVRCVTCRMASTSFKEYIGKWNTAAVTDMRSMFSGATSFNQDIGYWNTGAVTIMDSMFFKANTFNQNLGNWKITSVYTMKGMLDYSALNRLNYDNTLIGWAAQPITIRNVPLL